MQAAFGIAGDDIGEGAAAVDPEIPFARGCLLHGRPSHLLRARSTHDARGGLKPGQASPEPILSRAIAVASCERTLHGGMHAQRSVHYRLVGLGFAGFAGQRYASRATRCSSKTVSTPSADLGSPSTAVKVDNGRLMMIPRRAPIRVAVHNTAGVYDDIDMCVTATTVTGVDPTKAKA